MEGRRGTALRVTSLGAFRFALIALACTSILLVSSFGSASTAQAVPTLPASVSPSASATSISTANSLVVQNATLLANDSIAFSSLAVSAPAAVGCYHYVGNDWQSIPCVSTEPQPDDQA